MDTPAAARLRSPIYHRVSEKGSVRLGTELTRSVTEDEDGNTKGLKDRLRGHIGVRTSALKEG